MAAQRGRPPVGERITVRLPDRLVVELDQRADHDGTTRAATMRRLLEAALASAAPIRRIVDESTDTGVDLAQIRAQLARSPQERLRRNTQAVRRMRRLQHAARR